MNRLLYWLLVVISVLSGCAKNPKSFVIKNAFGSGHTLQVALPYDVRDSMGLLYRGGCLPTKKVIHYLQLFDASVNIGTITISYQEPLLEEAISLLNGHYTITSDFKESVCEGCQLLRSNNQREYLLITELETDSLVRTLFFSIEALDSIQFSILIESCGNAIVD